MAGQSQPIASGDAQGVEFAGCERWRDEELDIFDRIESLGERITQVRVQVQVNGQMAPAKVYRHAVSLEEFQQDFPEGGVFSFSLSARGVQGSPPGAQKVPVAPLPKPRQQQAATAPQQQSHQIPYATRVDEIPTVSQLQSSLLTPQQRQELKDLRELKELQEWNRGNRYSGVYSQHVDDPMQALPVGRAQIDLVQARAELDMERRERARDKSDHERELQRLREDHAREMKRIDDKIDDLKRGGGRPDWATDKDWVQQQIEAARKGSGSSGSFEERFREFETFLAFADRFQGNPGATIDWPDLIDKAGGRMQSLFMAIADASDRKAERRAQELVQQQQQQLLAPPVQQQAQQVAAPAPQPAPHPEIVEETPAVAKPIHKLVALVIEQASEGRSAHSALDEALTQLWTQVSEDDFNDALTWLSDVADVMNHEGIEAARGQVIGKVSMVTRARYRAKLESEVVTDFVRQMLEDWSRHAEAFEAGNPDAISRINLWTGEPV